MNVTWNVKHRNGPQWPRPPYQYRIIMDLVRLNTLGCSSGASSLSQHSKDRRIGAHRVEQVLVYWVVQVGNIWCATLGSNCPLLRLLNSTRTEEFVLSPRAAGEKRRCQKVSEDVMQVEKQKSFCWREDQLASIHDVCCRGRGLKGHPRSPGELKWARIPRGHKFLLCLSIDGLWPIFLSLEEPHQTQDESACGPGDLQAQHTCP